MLDRAVRRGAGSGRDRLRASGDTGKDPREKQTEAPYVEEEEGPDGGRAPGAPPGDARFPDLPMGDQCTGLRRERQAEAGSGQPQPFGIPNGETVRL